MEIRVADSSMADTLADLWVRLAGEQRVHGSHLLPEANRSTIREAILRHVVSDSVLVATNGDIHGFVMLTIERPGMDQDVTRGVVENVYVRPSRRNEGIGEALLAAAEERLRDRGAAVVALEVLADNEAARRLYERRGYEPHRIELERRWESDTHSKEDE